jgi:biotin carboxylase
MTRTGVTWTGLRGGYAPSPLRSAGMPTILLPYVDPAGRRALLARHGAALRALGLSLVLADDELSAADRALFDDCVELPPPAQVGGALEVLLAWAARHPLDGVCAESEAGLLPGVLLAERLGLPALSPRAALLASNKWLSRRAMAAGGVPGPAFALVRDAAGVRRFAAAHGWPVMLKAVSSCLSRNVLKVACAADVAAAVARLHAALPAAPDVLRCSAFARLAGLDMECEPTHDFLVEEFLEGEPLEVDGLSLRGAVTSFGVTGQVLSAGPQFHIEAYLAPVALPLGAREEAERVARASLAALGVDDTGFSIELRARGGRCAVIEVNARLGQDDGFPQLFARAVGREPLLMWLESLASGAPPAGLRARGHHALAYINHAAGGIFRGVESRPDACSPRGDADVRVLIEPGTALAPLGDPRYDPHIVAALASHAEDSVAALRTARDALAELRVRIDPAAEVTPAGAPLAPAGADHALGAASAS